MRLVPLKRAGIDSLLMEKQLARAGRGGTTGNHLSRQPASITLCIKMKTSGDSPPDNPILILQGRKLKERLNWQTI